MASRSVLVPIALAVVLVTAGCAGAFDTTTTASPRTTPDSTTHDSATQAASRTIQVGATGRVQATPDTVVLRVSVIAVGRNASVARRRLARNVSRMRAALADMGIGDGQITTSFFNIEREREYPPERDSKPKYRAQHAFTIRLNDTSRVGDVIVTAVEHGATSVENVEFVLAAETRRKLRKQALAEAMKHARTEAGIVAGAANLTIVGASHVQTTRIGVDGFEVDAVAKMAAAGAATEIEGGTITVTAQVVVVYNASAAG